MLLSVNLKNFQPYLDETLHLCEGVNVITGQSNSGKSAIVRGISWALQNVPRGDSFHCHHAKNGVTSATLQFDDGVIERRKSSSKNEYIINGDENDPKTALRTGVPDEVFEVTKMNDLNVQKQHESYFLFQQTSGQVATKINSIIGLEVMDYVLSTINQIVSETKKEVTDNEQKEVATRKDLEKLSWVDAAEAEIKALEESERRLVELETHCIDSAVLVKQARSLETEIKVCESYISIEEAYNTLIQEYVYLEGYISNNSYLREQLQKAKRFKKDLCVCDAFISIEPAYRELTETLKSLIQSNTANASLRNDVIKAQVCAGASKVCNLFLSIEPFYKELVEQQRQLTETLQAVQELQEATVKARIFRKDVQSIRRILRSAEPLIIDATDLHLKSTALVESIESLRTAVTLAKKYQAQFNACSEQEVAFEEEYHQCLGVNDTCPICGQMIQKTQSS
jgi:DNA repair protein SbcC/Rad50